MPINSPTENFDAWLEEVSGNQAEPPKEKKEKGPDTISKQKSDFKKETKEYGYAGEKAYTDVEDKIKQLRDAEKEALRNIENNETPPHSAMAEIHRQSTNQERLNIDYALIRRAFEHRGALDRSIEKVDSKGFEELSLTNIDELKNPAGLSEDDWKRIRRQDGPTVFFKEVPPQQPEPYGDWDPRRLLGMSQPKNETPSGEVLVIISMNNAEHPNAANAEEENTIVTMLLKHKGGILQWGDNNPAALYNIRSEKEFKASVAKGSKGEVEDRICTGDITVETYKKEFQKAHGKPLERHIREEDEKSLKEPDDLDPRAGKETSRREKLQKRREELMSNLSNEYTEQLQTFREGMSQILEQARGEMQALAELQDRINNDPKAKELISKAEHRAKKKNYQDYIRLLSMAYQVSEKDLINFLGIEEWK